ncbi:MAG: hypothetical protein ACI84D_001666 [Thalassolituus oleivorans]
MIGPSGWSASAGLFFNGRVRATYVRGHCVYDGSSVVGEAGNGRFVQPKT